MQRARGKFVLGLRQKQAAWVQGTERKPVWPDPDGKRTQWQRSGQGNGQQGPIGPARGHSAF